MADLEDIKAQAKLIASEAYNDGFGCDPWGAVIEALAAARSSTTCPRGCGGSGVLAGEEVRRDGAPTPDEICPSCDGSGTVPGGPLLLDLVAEQVGSLIGEGVNKELTFKQEASPLGRRSVPVYVAREST